MFLKRFTIRALLVVMIPICILLAIDTAVSSRLSNLRSELTESPTSVLELMYLGDTPAFAPEQSSTVKVEDWESDGVARWHLITQITDISTWRDRICFRRCLEINHKQQTQLGESILRSTPTTSEISIGLASTKIERKAPFHMGVLLSLIHI